MGVWEVEERKKNQFNLILKQQYQSEVKTRIIYKSEVAIMKNLL